MDPAPTIGAKRGDVVVCIAAGSQRDRLARCLHSVVAHSATEVAVLVYADAAEGALEHGLGAAGRAISAVADVEAAFAAAAPADVVILSSDYVVAEEWLDGLRDAAYADSRVATATALASDDPAMSHALPMQPSHDEAAAALRRASLRIRPRVPRPGGHCMYIRRSALELVGGFGDLREFSARCVYDGLCHVVADDVLAVRVGAPGEAATGAAAFTFDASEPLVRSLGAARRALEGLSIVIDARSLTGPMNGTRLHALELIAALARIGGHRIRPIVTADLDPGTRAQLEELPGVEPATSLAELGRSFTADVVHRPFQVESPADLAFLAQFGDRLVITQQDLIGYDNPSYFRSRDAWEAYRGVTRRAMAAADRVVFFSAHARDEALAEDLVERARASVVRIGVDHSLTRSSNQPPSPPQGAARLPADVEAMLCIGTDYRHKNRAFALWILTELRRRHEWHGLLLFAGSHMPCGSSEAEEAELLGEHPWLRQAVLDLGEVSEPEKEWLLGRASLVVYPTVYEGFGLVPFEAAERGVPCLWARGTSLGEILPDRAAGIVPWDAVTSAENALALIRDAHARERNVQAVRDAAAELRWDAAARRMIEVYRSACDDSPTLASVGERNDGLMGRGLSEDAIRLVGPHGALPPELERPLLALATHPKLRGPVFGAIKAGYRASSRLRRGRLNGNAR